MSECDQLSHQGHRSCVDKSILAEDKSETHEAKSAISAVNSFSPLSNSQVIDSHNQQASRVLAGLAESPEPKEGALAKEQYKAI